VRYLEAEQLLRGVVASAQAGVEDEELRVPQPGLQLLDASLQLDQQRVGERREGRAGVLGAATRRRGGRARRPIAPAGRARWRMLREDLLRRRGKELGRGNQDSQDGNVEINKP